MRFSKTFIKTLRDAPKDELAKKFKDNDSPMKIAIVVDMWLTGFDVPSLATMYVYKPMAGYNLMQAIARVNRLMREVDKCITLLNKPDRIGEELSGK